MAKVLRPTSETGQFWFFSPSNVELLVKIFDGRATNNAFWSSTGAATNVECYITVTDTEQDVEKVYSNPLGTFGSGGDIEAFPQ
ncbi:MAG: hypothetical protein R2862_09660 [Thermoanaerobaculia bacterium]